MSAGVVALALAAPARAAMLTFGPNLSSATPTLDTANGASSETDDEPLSLWYSTLHGSGSPTGDEGIATSFAGGCMRTYAPFGTYPCTPWIHTGADNTLWNTAIAGGSATASQGGQVVQIDVKGCTVQDPASSIQTSEGFPSNTMQFQALAQQSDGSYKVTPTAGFFQLPWCSNSSNPADPAAAVSTNTVTTYAPLHMCITPGETASFYDLGGQIPNPSGGPSFYPQGAPFMVIASVPGDATDSFTDADIANGIYAPGAQPRGDNSGFGSEPGQELMLSAVEGTGDDAYGQCPGGDALEGATSNTVICLLRPTNPGDTYGTCNAQQQPVFPPQNTAPPTISGTTQVGDFLKEAHGTWTNSPFGYKVQWERCDASGSNCNPISGETGTSYKLATADVGSTIGVQESATNDANTEGPVSSAQTAVVTARSGGGGGGSSTFVVGKLRLSKYAFRAAKGTTISWQDSNAGNSRLTVTKRGKTKVLWSSTHVDTAGANTSKFRDRKLRKGYYTLTLTTTYGGQTKTNTVTMRIVS